jgi:hypothetical protein
MKTLHAMLRTLRAVGISLAVAAVLIASADFILTKLGMGPEYFKRARD